MRIAQLLRLVTVLCGTAFLPVACAGQVPHRPVVARDRPVVARERPVVARDRPVMAQATSLPVAEADPEPRVSHHHHHHHHQLASRKPTTTTTAARTATTRTTEIG